MTTQSRRYIYAGGALGVCLVVAILGAAFSHKIKAPVPERIIYRQQPLKLIKDEAPAKPLTGIFSWFGRVAQAGIFDPPITLSLVAEVTPPVLNGQTLQASNITFNGNYAYVSYNLAGSTLMGALEVFDLTTPSHPVLAAQLLYPDAKVNSMLISGNRIFLVGNTTDETKGPAYMRVLRLTNGRPDLELAMIKLPSFAGTGVSLLGSRLYVTSGDTGGALTILDSTTYAVLSKSSLTDPRSVGSPIGSSEVMVFAAKPGRVFDFSQSASAISAGGATIRPGYQLSLGGANVAEAKGELQLGTAYGLASLGLEGFNLFCLADGKTIVSKAPVAVSGVATAKNATNGATISQGMGFTANGEAGVRAYTMTTGIISFSACPSVVAVDQGRIDFGTAISSNEVAYRNGLLFASAGLGGLKIVQVKTNFIGTLLTDFDQSGSSVVLSINISTGSSWTAVPANTTL